ELSAAGLKDRSPAPARLEALGTIGQAPESHGSVGRTGNQIPQVPRHTHRSHNIAMPAEVPQNGARFAVDETAHVDAVLGIGAHGNRVGLAGGIRQPAVTAWFAFF